MGPPFAFLSTGTQSALYFSLLAGNVAENGSQLTASSAIQSARIALVERIGRKAQFSAHLGGYCALSLFSGSLSQRNDAHLG
jgi:hypothetical protein